MKFEGLCQPNAYPPRSGHPAPITYQLTSPAILAAWLGSQPSLPILLPATTFALAVPNSLLVSLQHHCFQVAPPFAQPNQHSHHSPLLHPPHYPVSALVISIADCSTTSSPNLTTFVVAHLPSCAAASYQLHQIALLRQYQTALAASKIVLKSQQAPSECF
ncbi:hypothetical protein PCANC_24115 [Puccinia coronata f. sp. avenae]|uniref:Uncharacterized protein n=1 Tax=Puccinia coronata f. sp. avenae TaxID=200324 RepID=A0A2N5SQW2_9BASI|nr:hypothetical protein PCANC_24115 [Puccinia coronata f. sp. avenae]